MASKVIIKAAIELRISNSQTKYSSWRIGLTHDLADRKVYWRDTARENVACWTSWTTDSLSDAQDIESHFINTKGMKGGTGGDLKSYKTVYVYIF